MTTQSTIDKLIEMRLTAMSDAFIIQKDDPKMKEVPFEDRFGMLPDLHCILILQRFCLLEEQLYQIIVFLPTQNIPQPTA